MEGPLSQVLKFSFGTEMFVSVLVGVGFGWMLERGGFGRADNLVANFYGTDFRVLRVMFTAVVTAMIGLFFLDVLKILPLSSIGLLDTYLPAQALGGFLLGAGFVIGGYCPGTSVVAVVSGKIDALIFVVGVAVGSGIFTLNYDTLAAFQNSGARGRVLLSDYFHVPSGVVVFAVSLAAIGAFWAVGKIEARVNGRPAAPRPVEGVGAAAGARSAS